MLPLSSLGRALGLDVKLISADEAYNDSDGELEKQTGVHLVKPANSKVRLPPNVDEKTMNVTLDDLCEIPMEYAGAGDRRHEFKCAAAPGECFREGACPRVRRIEFDDGVFQNSASEQVGRRRLGYSQALRKAVQSFEKVRRSGCTEDEEPARLSGEGHIRDSGNAASRDRGNQKEKQSRERKAQATGIASGRVIMACGTQMHSRLGKKGRKGFPVPKERPSDVYIPISGTRTHQYIVCHGRNGYSFMEESPM